MNPNRVPCEEIVHLTDFFRQDKTFEHLDRRVNIFTPFKRLPPMYEKVSKTQITRIMQMNNFVSAMFVNKIIIKKKKENIEIKIYQ